MLALVTLMLLATTACSSGEKPSTGGDSDAKSTTMMVEVTTAPVGMHPLTTNDAASTAISGQVFETLYARTIDGSAYEPLLAAEMPEFSEDGLTATIKLRQGVKFHDGSDFTAEAVAYMIDSIKNPEYGSLRPSIVESIESYEIVDDHTIVLHTSYVDGVLIAKLAHTNAAIVNPNSDKNQDIMIDASGAGTGPFKFESSVPGSTYTLVANEEYWGGAPEVKKVQFDVVADESTAIARLQTGEADFYATVSADAMSTVSNIDGVTLVSDTNSSVQYLAARSTKDTAANPLMENIEFRKAIIQAIDFDTFIETMLPGVATRSQSVVGPTLVGYTSEMEKVGYTYDKEAAKAIIKANGWEGETVTLYCATRKNHQDLAVYVQAQLAEIGLNLNIVSEEWAAFLSNAKEDKKFDIIFLSWSNVTGDGQQMLEPNFSTKNGLRVKYNNAEFDQAVEASALTTVKEEREAFMLEAVKKIQGDAVTTPIYSSNQIYAYNSKKFGNVKLDASGKYDLGDVTVK